MQISFIIPSRNNYRFLKWSYDSIRKNQGNHDVQICVADDASTDGTWEWCQETMQQDKHFQAIRNDGPERQGLVILNDRLVNEVAKHDLCIIYHADMYLCPGALDAIENHMYSVDTFSREELEQDKLEEYERETGEKIDKLNVKVRHPKTIVSLTRIEPPLHPDGPEKVLRDFGVEPEEFDEDGLLNEVQELKVLHRNDPGTTEGIFAPWAFWKKDFQEIGGHDKLFAPQSKEDSDIFNRFQLNGVKFIQTWEGFVYHMTSRGSRFNPASGGAPGKDSPEWLHTTTVNMRNFIRKWGTTIKHDQYMKPIISPKYNIGIKLKNGNLQLLELLEPWCDTIYTEETFTIGRAQDYIEKEQENTLFDLSERAVPYDNEMNNDILVEIDGMTFTQPDFGNIQQLADIIQDTDELGEFEIGNLKISIFNIESYERDLIVRK
jgi:glycosyltransferase involved in cell wall biosynthesis